MKNIVSLLLLLSLAACGGSDAIGRDGAACVDNVDCGEGHHWEQAACGCVSNDDLGSGCTATCDGGTTGCGTMCPGGCEKGQLCCAWAGGPCSPDDGGMCNNGGFKCATATSQGVCPQQCYP